MKRLTIVLTAAAVSLTAVTAAAAIPGAGISGAAVDAHVARGAKLQVRHTALGNIVLSGGGVTVYAFTRDSRRHDRCAALAGCTGIWPPLSTNGVPRAGRGIRHSLLGTITLAGGTRQVTYAGHPLYTYIGDRGPGDTSYVGVSQFGGHWVALTAAGHLVK